MGVKLGWSNVWNSEVHRVVRKHPITVILTLITVRDLPHAPWLRRVGLITRRIHHLGEIIHGRDLQPLIGAHGQRAAPSAPKAGAIEKSPAGMVHRAHLNIRNAVKAGQTESHRVVIAMITWSVQAAP